MYLTSTRPERVIARGPRHFSLISNSWRLVGTMIQEDTIWVCKVEKGSIPSHLCTMVHKGRFLQWERFDNMDDCMAAVMTILLL